MLEKNVISGEEEEDKLRKTLFTMDSLRTQCEKRDNFSHYFGLLNIKVETHNNYMLQTTKEK